ncbi:rhodopsin orphan GPCR [Schistosoma japonicum]|uniref:Rhodopsin orphan GPCR n=1 Tax=Schistosoma japonicum TaxID=6182 RepID=A0A4Z2CTN6_SCHJA|nr:rhodopsin orphan GPCR [Schistosoma japonicum]
MNITEYSEDVSYPFILNLFIINKSTTCTEMESLPVSGLFSFYRAIGLLLGPLNTLLNGLCVHIFNHSLWKKSVMSRILKGLSIIELGMGLSLFIHALIFSQNSTSSHSQQNVFNINNTINNTYTNYDQQIPYQHQFELNYTETNAYIKTICSFFIMTISSRLLVAFQISRNWSVVLLAAYRYDQICRPIGTPSAFPRERIRYILMIIFSLACFIVIPRIFESGIVVCYISGSVSNDFPLLINYKLYQILYLGLVMFIVQSGGPVICVCVLSAFIIRIIAKRRRFHREKEKRSARNLLRRQTMEIETNQTNLKNNINNNNNQIVLQRNSNGLTKDLIERPAPSGDKLMFTVCITFFILETPAFFSKILNPYLEQDYPLIDLTLSVIANLLIYLDSTLNAFIYMASNPLFRQNCTRRMHTIS